MSAASTGAAGARAAAAMTAARPRRVRGRPTSRATRRRRRKLPRRALDPVEVVWRGWRLAELDLLHRGDQLLVGRRGAADLTALLDDDAVDEVDLGTPALLHVLAHRRALVLAALLRVPERQHQRFALVQRRPVALRGTRQLLGVLAGDVFELVARRLANPHRFAAELDDDAADALVLPYVVARQPACRRNPIVHAVDAQF